MEHQVKIRLATIQDVKELLRLNKNQYMKNQLEEFARWKMQNYNEMIAVAEIQNNLIGFACAQLQISFCHEEVKALINEVYVEESYRKKGIATALIQLIESYLVKGEVKQITVVCDSKCEAMTLLAEKHGFVRKDKIIFQKNK